MKDRVILIFINKCVDMIADFRIENLHNNQYNNMCMPSLVPRRPGDEARYTNNYHRVWHGINNRLIAHE